MKQMLFLSLASAVLAAGMVLVGCSIGQRDMKTTGQVSKPAHTRSVSAGAWTLQAGPATGLVYTKMPPAVTLKLEHRRIGSFKCPHARVHLRFTQTGGKALVREAHHAITFESSKEGDHKCQAVIEKALPATDEWPTSPYLLEGNYLLDVEATLEDGTEFRLEGIPVEVRRVTY